MVQPPPSLRSSQRMIRNSMCWKIVLSKSQNGRNTQVPIKNSTRALIVLRCSVEKLITEIIGKTAKFAAHPIQDVIKLIFVKMRIVGKFFHRLSDSTLIQQCINDIKRLQSMNQRNCRYYCAVYAGRLLNNLQLYKFIFLLIKI